jgi:hypothetical protein
MTSWFSLFNHFDVFCYKMYTQFLVGTRTNSSEAKKETETSKTFHSSADESITEEHIKNCMWFNCEFWPLIIFHRFDY